MSDGARWDSSYHAPVLAEAVVRLLAGEVGVAGADGGDVQPDPLDAMATGAGRTVIDGTLGGGGHALALLEAGFRVIGLDRDPEALAGARERLADHATAGAFVAYQANYARPEAVDALAGIQPDAVLLDLGISSHQIDDAGRGFTFREGAPLDMRMGFDAPSDAAGLLATLDERELARIFRDYGDEPRGARLAREIVRRRANAPFATSDDLVRAIRGAFGPRTGPGDFARLFQAVRIAVNDELAGLERALPLWRDRLRAGGRLAIIAYHSGEDRLVKHAFRGWSTGCTCPPRQPMCTCGGAALGHVVTRRGIGASEAEIARNPRARSARLRVWERGGARA